MTTTTTSFAQWLESIGMSQYEENFRRHNISADQLSLLTESDLEKIGIESLGHRKTIIASIHNISSSIQNRDIQANVARLRMRVNKLLKWYFIIAAGLTLLATVGFLFGADQGAQGNVIVVLLLCVLSTAFVYVYFLPSIIAWKKGHDFRWGILIVNTLFGVTLVVWIILLVFALRFITPITAAVLTGLSPQKK